MTGCSPSPSTLRGSDPHDCSVRAFARTAVMSGTDQRCEPRSVAELAAVLLAEHTVVDLAERIVRLSIQAVAGVDHASASIISDSTRRLETAAATSELVVQLDQTQYRGGGGPCVEATRSGEEVLLHIPCGRWEKFENEAACAEVRTVCSLPLRAGDATMGSLNLYSFTALAWEAPPDPARLVARQGSILLANARALATTEATNQHLQEALMTRELIGQAKGILMARQDVTSEEAFDILRRASQRSNRKLRDIAAAIVTNLDSVQRAPPGPDREDSAGLGAQVRSGAAISASSDQPS